MLFSIPALVTPLFRYSESVHPPHRILHSRVSPHHPTTAWLYPMMFALSSGEAGEGSGREGGGREGGEGEGEAIDRTEGN